MGYLPVPIVLWDLAVGQWDTEGLLVPIMTHSS
jgi:hypothetical protein